MKRILENVGVTPEQLKTAAINMGMDPEQIEQHFEEDEDVIQIRIEKVGRQLLVYRMETDQFITQATTAKRLLNQLAELAGDGKTTYNIGPEDGLKYIKKELDKRAD